MADLDDDDFSLDDDDFELDDWDFGDDMDGGDWDASPPPDNRNPVLRLGGAAISGLGKVFTDESFQRRLIKQNLPEGFDDAYDTGMLAVKSVGDITRTVDKEMGSIISNAKQTLTRVSPSIEKQLPPALAKRLNEFTSKHGTKSWDSSGNYDPDQQEREGGIKDFLDTLEAFKTKEEYSKKTVMNREDASKLRGGAIQQRLLDTGNRAQEQTNQLLNKLLGYHTEVTTNYQMKSLELQYNQFFMARKQVDLAEQSLNLAKDSYDKLIHNTALPDAVKLRISEQWAGMTKEKVINTLQGKFTDSLGSYIRKGANKVKENITEKAEKVKEGLGEIENMLSMLDMLNSMDDEPPGAREQLMRQLEMAIDMGASFAGPWFEKIIRKYADQRAVGSNGKLIDTGQKIKAFLGNGGQKINSWLNSERDSGIGALDNLRWVMNGTGWSRDSKLTENKIEDMNESSFFDFRTKRTINEIIPGYLKMIHHELKMTRTGDHDISSVSFDWEKNDFNDDTSIKDRLKEKFTGKDSSLQRNAKSVQQFLKQLDPTNQLSRETKKSLMSIIADKQSDGGSFFDVYELIKNFNPKGKGGVTDQKQKDELVALLQNHGIDVYADTSNELELQNTIKNHSGDADVFYNSFNKALARARSNYDNSNLQEIQNLIGLDSNYGRMISQFGLINQDDDGGFSYNWEDDINRTRQKAKKGSFAIGGSTGPGDKYEVKGDVHADEYVIRSEVATQPGVKEFLDQLNMVGGNLLGRLTGRAGYAAGGDVADTYTPASETSNKAGVSLESIIEAIRSINPIQHLKNMSNSLKGIEFGALRNMMGTVEKIPSNLTRFYEDRIKSDKPNISLKQTWDRFSDRLKQNKLLGTISNKFSEGVDSIKEGYHQGRRMVDPLYTGGLPKVESRNSQGLEAGFENIHTEHDEDDITKYQADIFTEDDLENPKLTADGFKNGEYVDQMTGRAIQSAKDIKGVVLDKWGNIKLSAKDLAKKLISPSTYVEAIVKVSKVTWSAQKKVAGKLFELAVKHDVLGKVRRGIRYAKRELLSNITSDVYIEGEEEPVLMKKDIYDGNLYNGEREQIKQYKDIKGTIYDKEGNVVLEESRYDGKKLLDASGKPLLGFGRKTIRRLKNLGGKAWKGVKGFNKFRKKAWQAQFKLMYGARDMLGRGVDLYNADKQNNQDDNARYQEYLMQNANPEGLEEKLTFKQKVAKKLGKADTSIRDYLTGETERRNKQTREIGTLSENADGSYDPNFQRQELPEEPDAYDKMVGWFNKGKEKAKEKLEEKLGNDPLKVIKDIRKKVPIFLRPTPEDGDETKEYKAKLRKMWIEEQTQKLNKTKDSITKKVKSIDWKGIEKDLKTKTGDAVENARYQAKLFEMSLKDNKAVGDIKDKAKEGIGKAKEILVDGQPYVEKGKKLLEGATTKAKSLLDTATNKTKEVKSKFALDKDEKGKDAKEYAGKSTGRLLRDVHRVLVERLEKPKAKVWNDSDGNGFREGSVEDQLADKMKRKDEPEKVVQTVEKEKKKGSGILPILMGLVTMVGGFIKKVFGFGATLKKWMAKQTALKVAGNLLAKNPACCCDGDSGGDGPDRRRKKGRGRGRGRAGRLSRATRAAGRGARGASRGLVSAGKGLMRMGTPGKLVGGALLAGGVYAGMSSASADETDNDLLDNEVANSEESIDAEGNENPNTTVDIPDTDESPKPTESGAGTMSRVWAGTKDVLGLNTANGVADFAKDTAISTGVIAAGAGAISGLMGGTGMAAGALAALGGPITLGIIAGGLAIYGGIKLYQYLKEGKQPILKFRMAQYGFKDSSETEIGQIAKLEAELVKDTKVHGSEVAFSNKDTAVAKAIKILGIDTNKPDQMQYFSEWFTRRFKPVFFSWIGGMNSIKPGLKLEKLDDNLKPEEVTSLLSSIHSEALKQGVYSVTTSYTGKTDLLGQDEVEKILNASKNTVDKPQDRAKREGEKEKTLDKEVESTSYWEKTKSLAKTLYDYSPMGLMQKAAGAIADKVVDTAKAVGNYTGDAISSGFNYLKNAAENTWERAKAMSGTNKEKYNKIRNAALQAGDPHPDIVAAQWALESGWGKKQSGKFNFFGIKAAKGEKGTTVRTREVYNGQNVMINAAFKDYASLEEGIADRVAFIKRNPRYTKSGYFSAKTPYDAAVALQKGGYATDPNYANLLCSIIKGCGYDPKASSADNTKKASPVETAKDKTTPAPAQVPQQSPAVKAPTNQSPATNGGGTLLDKAKQQGLLNNTGGKVTVPTLADVAKGNTKPTPFTERSKDTPAAVPPKPQEKPKDDKKFTPDMLLVKNADGTPKVDNKALHKDAKAGEKPQTGGDNKSVGGFTIHKGKWSYKDFPVKSSEATAGGPAHQGIINLAYDIYKNMPGVFRFTAFNDLYHKGKNSKHAVGLALDYTLKDRSQYAIQEKQLVAMFKKFGIGAKVIDECNRPSSRATGAHMHVNFNSKADADKYLSLAGQSADMDYKGSGFAIPYAKEDEDGAGGSNPGEPGVVSSENGEGGLAGFKTKYAGMSIAEIFEKRAKAGVKVYGLDGTVKDFADLSETAPDVNGKQETKEQAKVNEAKDIQNGNGIAGNTGVAVTKEGKKAIEKSDAPKETKEINKTPESTTKSSPKSTESPKPTGILPATAGGTPVSSQSNIPTVDKPKPEVVSEKRNDIIKNSSLESGTNSTYNNASLKIQTSMDNKLSQIVSALNKLADITVKNGAMQVDATKQQNIALAESTKVLSGTIIKTNALMNKENGNNDKVSDAGPGKLLPGVIGAGKPQPVNIQS